MNHLGLHPQSVQNRALASLVRAGAAVLGVDFQFRQGWRCKGYLLVDADGQGRAPGCQALRLPPQTGQAFWDPLRIEQTVEWFYVRQAEGAVEMKFLQVLPAADANMTNDDRDELVEAATVGEEAAKMASVLLQVWTDESVWLNTALDSRLELQLKDAISIATQALPGWCALLTSCARFLFTPATRNRFLWCTAFGVSRALTFFSKVILHGAHDHRSWSSTS